MFCLVKYPEKLLLSIIVFEVIGPEDLRGTSIEVLEKLSGKTHLSGLVASAKFGPGFFYQLDPELVLARFVFGEGKLLNSELGLAEWEVVVHGDDALLTVNDELEGVAASLVGCLSHEVVLHSFTLLVAVVIQLFYSGLCQTRESSKGIAVIDCSHDDIRRIHTIKDVPFHVFIKLRGSFPVEIRDPLLLAVRVFLLRGQMVDKE